MRAPPVWLTAAFLLGGVALASADAQTRGSPNGIAGTSQSPVDIRPDDLQLVATGALPRLTIRYAHGTRLDLENTGAPSEHATEKAHVSRGAGEVRTGGRTYQLVEFHWHVPAEHLVNGERLPMELHLVHRGADGSPLVVGVLVREGVSPPALSTLFHALPADSGAHVAVPAFDLTALLPLDHRSVRYRGSLTTPPFAEGVRWIVLTAPIELGPTEIAAFRALFPEGNAREVQALAGRRIMTDDARLARGLVASQKAKAGAHP